MRTLTAGALALEPQVAAHAAELFPVLSNPALYVFTDAKRPSSEKWLRDRFARLESRVSPDGTQRWLNWIVRDGDGVAVGYVQASVRAERAEIAYVIGREFWRRGYAREACIAMLAELASGYGVKRATATIDPRNAASIGLIEKLGFVPEPADADSSDLRFARTL